MASKARSGSPVTASPSAAESAPESPQPDVLYDTPSFTSLSVTPWVLSPYFGIGAWPNAVVDVPLPPGSDGRVVAGPASGSTVVVVASSAVVSLSSGTSRPADTRELSRLRI